MCHRVLAQRMLITMCDLISTFKPWHIYKAQVDVLFEEFYKQVRNVSTEKLWAKFHTKVSLRVTVRRN